MKTPALLLTALLAAASAATISAEPGHGHGHDAGHAHGHGSAAKPEWSPLFGDAPLPVVWRSATAARDNIEAALAAQKLAGVAAWAETIHLAAHALADQVKTPDEAAHKRLAAALAQAAKLADEVLDAAQHNNARAATSSFTRLKSALLVAQGRVPAELLEAAAAPDVAPRFAAEPAHKAHNH
jgi:hypothetical protein